MSKNKENLKKEISYYSEEKEKQKKEILARINFQQKLVSTIKMVIIINTIIFIVALIAMSIISGQNILELKENTLKGYIGVLDIVFLTLCLDSGISFIITSFRKIEKIYKTKSLKIGIEIIIATFMLGVIFSGVLR